ncbi:unnamed protein product [Kuraishia capsulata CBS 1993]|uniref:Uncharacterized protein n=1 Tax=Kuraishia capsulata CBS 1993 TaxID=1382522 RepID=W6MIP0_9ASCO|nr:uncharacterized protein KUCA_T00000207001 [Kuraishia capsulata CBS 1993]CDK24247.1 unnamed protein product [Kuraishia capsulata CBS 1993]
MDMKKVPKEVMMRGRGLQMIIVSIPLIIFPGLELYRRYFQGGERKIQVGEYNPRTGVIREFDEEEKMAVHKSRWITRIFGDK